MSITSRVSGLVILLCCAIASHGSSPPGPSRDPAAIRTIYENSPDLPDGDAFFAAMIMVTHMERDSAESMIRAPMDLSPSDAADLVDLIRTTKSAYDTDLDGLTDQMLCARRHSLTADEIYSIFEALDDAGTALAAQHLALLKANIGPSNSALFQQWLDDIKLRTISVKQKHKVAYETSGQDVVLKAHKRCDQIDLRR